MRQREKKMEKLYEIEKDIANATNIQYLRLNVNARLESIFPAKFDVLIKGDNNQLILDSQLPQLALEKEKTAALWSSRMERSAAGPPIPSRPQKASTFPLNTQKQR